jgi:hypothetical protein
MKEGKKNFLLCVSAANGNYRSHYLSWRLAGSGAFDFRECSSLRRVVHQPRVAALEITVITSFLISQFPGPGPSRFRPFHQAVEACTRSTSGLRNFQPRSRLMEKVHFGGFFTEEKRR